MHRIKSGIVTAPEFGSSVDLQFAVRTCRVIKAMTPQRLFVPDGLYTYTDENYWCKIKVRHGLVVGCGKLMECPS